MTRTHRRLLIFIALSWAAWGCAQIALELPLPWAVQALGILTAIVALAGAAVWAISER